MVSPMAPVWAESPRMNRPRGVMRANSALERLMPLTALVASPTLMGRDGNEERIVTLPRPTLLTVLLELLAT